MKLKDHFKAVGKAKTADDIKEAARNGLAYMDKEGLIGIDTLHLRSFLHTMEAVRNDKWLVYNLALKGVQDIKYRRLDL